MERVSDEWINDVIPKYSAIDGKSKGGNVYLALCELRERRQNEIKSQHEVEKFIDAFWCKVRNLAREAEKERGDIKHSEEEKGSTEATQEREKAILPLPVKNVDGVSVETWTVKDWFQKINEELDELKEDVMCGVAGLKSYASYSYCSEGSREFIADEAADTITAITSMLEAMEIDERQRQAAQERVNERNAERKRL